MRNFLRPDENIRNPDQYTKKRRPQLFKSLNEALETTWRKIAGWIYCSI